VQGDYVALDTHRWRRLYSLVLLFVFLFYVIIGITDLEAREVIAQKNTEGSFLASVKYIKIGTSPIKIIDDIPAHEGPYSFSCKWLLWSLNGEQDSLSREKNRCAFRCPRIMRAEWCSLIDKASCHVGLQLPCWRFSRVRNDYAELRFRPFRNQLESKTLLPKWMFKAKRTNPGSLFQPRRLDSGIQSSFALRHTALGGVGYRFACLDEYLRLLASASYLDKLLGRGPPQESREHRHNDSRDGDKHASPKIYSLIGWKLGIPVGWLLMIGSFGLGAAGYYRLIGGRFLLATSFFVSMMIFQVMAILIWRVSLASS
jgi:hypothetical protein